jgi:hypothetical protein
MARDPFANYDAWLEAPIQRMYADEDLFERFCEAEGFDVDDPDARAAFDEQGESDAEDAQIARWEAAREEDG